MTSSASPADRPEAPLQVDVVTPNKRIAAGAFDFVVAPAADGEVGILPGHHPLMCVLGIGQMRLYRDGVVVDRLAVEKGYLEVDRNRVIVLAESAERASEIDAERARRAERRARERLAHPAGVDVRRAEAALARALARLHLAESHRR